MAIIYKLLIINNMGMQLNRGNGFDPRDWPVNGHKITDLSLKISFFLNLGIYELIHVTHEHKD